MRTEGKMNPFPGFILAALLCLDVNAVLLGLFDQHCMAKKKKVNSLLLSFLALLYWNLNHRARCMFKMPAYSTKS